MDKLLPCPRCGADGIVYALDGYRPSSPKTYKPYCSADCGIYASVEFMSEDSAVKWWNRRVPTERTIVDVGVGKSIMVGFEDILGDDVPTERTPQAQPQPDWSTAPAWAMWWTVEPDGNIHWHEQEPTVIFYYWHSDGRHEEVVGGFVTIPLGIDWRLLKAQRPQT